MNKHLDSSIQFLKQMLGDQSNELELAQQRALALEVRKLTKLKKQHNVTHDELYRVVSEVAETVSKILSDF